MRLAVANTANKFYSRMTGPMLTNEQQEEVQVLQSIYDLRFKGSNAWCSILAELAGLPPAFEIAIEGNNTGSLLTALIMDSQAWHYRSR